MNNTTKEYIYWILTSLFLLSIFCLNSNNLSQVDVYYKVILPLGKSILAGNAYALDGAVAFYPLWGYTLLQIPGLIFSKPELFTLSIQFVLSLVAIYYFYKVFPIKKCYWHLIFFLPFFAIMSVKIPDAIVAFLLIPYIYYQKEYYQTKQFKYIILSGIAMGIAANFRSEYLFLPVFQAVMFAIFAKTQKKYIASSTSITMLIMILFLLPWASRSYIETDDVRFTASNGGAVAYISLGQLPNNAWNIAPFDSTAYSVAKAKGIDNPFNIQGDKYFKSEFRKLILKNPFEFVKKIGYNGAQVFYRGVYTGEFANISINPKERYKINSKLLAKGSQVNQLISLFDYNYSIYLPILSEKFIQFLFMIVLLSIFAIILSKSLSFQYISEPLNLMILSLIIYRIITISIIQYEYRHTNSFYLLALGLALPYLSIIFGKVKQRIFRGASK